MAQQDIIADVRERMARFPNVVVHSDSSSITYYPENTDGFIVRLAVDRNARYESYTVYYNSSSEHFTDSTSAIRAFAFGLSTGCRLREYWVSGRPIRWIVDARAVGEKTWQPDWDVVSWFFALALLWRKPTIRILQNRLIDLDNDASDPTRRW
jgi:hypothetical protein